MKLKKEFVLKEIAGSTVLVPVGKTAVNFNGMVKLNDTAVYLFKLIEKGYSQQEIVSSLVNDYDVSEAQAVNDVSSFIKKLRDADIIE